MSEKDIFSLIAGTGIGVIGLVVTLYAYDGALEWLWVGGLTTALGLGILVKGPSR